MRGKQRRFFAIAVFAAVVALGLSPDTGQGASPPIIVTCSNTNFGTVTLDSTFSVPGPLTFVIRGTCIANVVITRDDVTLTTDATTRATITAANPGQPTILIDGAHRIVIDGVFAQGITISGGANGLTATRGSTLNLTNCHVTGNTGYSIVSSYGSTATISNCTIGPNTGNGALAADVASLVVTNSTVTANAGIGLAGVRGSNLRLGTVTVSGSGSSGVVISQNSSARIEGSTISDNEGSGVGAYQGSDLRIGTSLVSGNSLSGLDVSARSSAALSGGNSITQNADSSGWRAGIGIYNGSSVVIIESQTDHVFNNRGSGIFVSNNSSLLFKKGVVDSNAGDGVTVNNGSTAQFDVEATITRNVGYGIQCSDRWGASNPYGNRPANLSQNGRGETNCSW